jgi:hypothetical protein
MVEESRFCFSGGIYLFTIYYVDSGSSVGVNGAGLAGICMMCDVHYISEG